MRKIYPLILFSFLSLLIVLFWFKDGLYYAGAEVGLSPFYNPERYLSIQQTVWWGDVAPGVLVPQFISAVPLYYILSFLQKLLSPFVIQSLLFFLLIFLMGYGMYLFAVYNLNKDKKRYALLAGLFYILNAYVLVEVWHRFLYTGIFLAAAIPILALFWQRWIKEGKTHFLSIFLLINLAFSYMYGNLTSFIAVWLLCFLISTSQIFLPWQGRKSFFNIVSKSVAGFFFFLLTNLWWLIPVLKVSTQVLPQQHSIEDNIGTLVNISKQTALPFTLQFANPFYLFYSKELGDIYSNIFFLIFPWIPALVILIGVLFSLRNKYLSGIGLSYLIAIMISKGAAAPFGYSYIWGFMNAFFIGIIRNPFEKLGILLPFFGSLLFVIGLESLFLFCQKKYGNFSSKALVIVILGSIVVYVFPMLTGGILYKSDHSLKVKVPVTYELVNDWFKMQKNEEGNILHLPFSGGDVATYNWKNGYHGVEINEILFTTLPSITRNVGVKRVDDTIKSFTYLFVPAYSNNKEQILEVLQNFNVKFIVLHKDIVWQDKNTYPDIGSFLDPTIVEKTLNGLYFLQKQQEFGDLIVYKLEDKYYKRILSVSSSVQIISPGKTDIMQILSYKDKGKEFISLPDKNETDLFKKQTSIIFPYKRIDNMEASDSAMISKINDIYSNQSLSPIVKQIFEMRNYFAAVGYLQSSQLTENLILSTQEILRIYGQYLQNKIRPSSDQIDGYELMMRDFFKKYSQNLSIHILYENYISSQLRLHVFILKQLDQNNTAKLIEGFMVDNQLLPIHSNISGTVFKFDIPQTGNYQLLYPSLIKNTDIKINGEKIISTDNIAITQGQQEISLSGLYQGLLGESKNDIVLKSKSIEEPLLGGEILSIKKENSVRYSGKIKINGPSFIMFAQSYHPGWVLTLSKERKEIEVPDHLIGNLYNNAWWVTEEGDFDFLVEFTPQKYAFYGLIFSLLGWTGLLIVTTLSILNKGSKKGL